MQQTKMEDSIKTWNRKYFAKPLNKPMLFYVVYGNFTADFKIPHEKYRTRGLLPAFKLMNFGPDNKPEVVKSFLKGYVWKTLIATDAVLAKKVSDSQECFVLTGEINDSSNLDYLRDVVGVITYLLDNGGECVYDPQAVQFFGKKRWMDNIFDPDGSVPRNHVIILVTEEKDGKWYHTRGLRKFGRPDLSIHQVNTKYEDAVYDLFNRFIEYEGFGGIIAEGQEIKMKDLPAGMWCETKGDFEDLDFNNQHVEIHWK